MKQEQVDRGEIVTLDVPEIGSLRVTLPQNVQSGMAVRLYQALPNQRSLIAHVRIDQ